MQKVLIVEDDLKQNKMLYDAINARYPHWTIHSATNYTEAEQYISDSLTNKSNKLYTLFLFGVQLSASPDDRGGFLLAEALRKHKEYFKTPILFLTAISGESAFALSNFHCYNYITKPYTSEQILSQLEQMLMTGYLENTITIIDINRISFHISVNDIIYIESKRHVMELHFEHSSISTREYSLEEFEKMIGIGFLKCHRRYIINTSCINNFDKTNMLIKIGDTSIPVSRSYKSQIEGIFSKE